VMKTHRGIQIEREIEVGEWFIRLLNTERCANRRQADGCEMWWFGGEPPEGIPDAGVFIESVIRGEARKYPPPWAAVAYSQKAGRCWICSDPIGLQHLFIRRKGKVIWVGPACLKVANVESVTIDPIGAYELLSRGNPQGGRTLFSEIRCLDAATVIEVQTNRIKERQYWWPPESDPIGYEEAIGTYCDAVREAVVRHYKADDVQELTAGRDSLMILSALLHEGIRPRVWTLGEREDPDLLGASRRAKQLGVEHIQIRLEPLLEKRSEEVVGLVKRYLLASGGQTDAVNYSHLPWVLDQLGASGSITGVGGEVFRGFYYQWVGKGVVPLWLGKRFLLHGKIKAQMPFANHVIKQEIARLGNAVIVSDINQVFDSYKDIWHCLDVYYLMHRMHYFAGCTFSSTGQWTKVRMPLFDPRVLDCLAKVPIGLRHWSGGLVKEVTKRMLPEKRLEDEHTFSCETTPFRVKRLGQRLVRELRGGYYRGLWQRLARLVFEDKWVLRCLDPADMISTELYNANELRILIRRVQSGAPIPLILGGILTIEMAARAANSEMAGTRET
jgi:hypothetical protein